MNRLPTLAAFAAGLLVLGWTAAGYLADSPLALAVTALIAAGYLAGGVELWHYRRATQGLLQALAVPAVPPPAWPDWLDGLPPALQTAVRRRVETGAGALPGPQLTPYLTGLLVLLGMLGTFLGMVVTLRGTGLALETASDVATIRASLAAPVQGLGLAFGTSVAGVAASAMLGLVAAFSRRDRQHAARRLDAAIAGWLRPHSQANAQARQRDEALALLQRQAEALPALVARVDAAMALLERQAQAQDQRHAEGQARLQAESRAAQAELAATIERTLGAGLRESARLAADAMQPVVAATLAGMAREGAALQQAQAHAAREHLDTLSTRFDAGSARLLDGWQQAFDAQVQAQQRQWAEAMARGADQLGRTLAQRADAIGQGLAEAAGRIASGLARTADDIGARGQAHTEATLAAIDRLVQTAAQAPQAAAEVMAALRTQLTEAMARDQALLAERERLLQTLAALLDTVRHAAGEQRAAIDALVEGAATALSRAGTQFAERADATALGLADAAAQVAAGGVEMASLGDAFGLAVQQFGAGSQALSAQLQRIEAALAQTLSRSDDQLAYYVAQARELIELSVLSQKRLVDEVQQLARRPAEPVDEAA